MVHRAAFTVIMLPSISRFALTPLFASRHGLETRRIAKIVAGNGTVWKTLIPTLVAIAWVHENWRLHLILNYNGYEGH